MAQGAFHSPAVLLLFLMTNETDLGTPCGETSLVLTRVTGCASRGVCQLCHVLLPCGWSMAVPAVLFGRVLKGMALGTGVVRHCHGRGLVAKVTAETHVQVGLVDEASGGHCKRISAWCGVTETTRSGRVRNMMTGITSRRALYLQAPMLVEPGMTGGAAHPGIHRMPPVGETATIPENVPPAALSEVAGGTLPFSDGGAHLNRRQSRTGPTSSGGILGHLQSGPKKVIGKLDVVDPLSHLHQAHVLLGRPDE